MTVHFLTDHTLYNFMDEKQFVNHNGTKLRARIDHLTGILDGIPIDGNFRNAHSLTFCISGNYKKKQHVFYLIGKNTNTAASFMDFVERMVAEGFLIHQKILVMDNASIHCKKLLFWKITCGQPKSMVIHSMSLSP